MEGVKLIRLKVYDGCEGVLRVLQALGNLAACESSMARRETSRLAGERVSSLQHGGKFLEYLSWADFLTSRVDGRQYQHLGYAI